MDGFYDDSLTKEKQEKDAKQLETGIKAEASCTSESAAEPKTKEGNIAEGCRVPRVSLGKRAADAIPTDIERDIKKRQLGNVATAVPSKAGGEASNKEQESEAFKAAKTPRLPEGIPPQGINPIYTPARPTGGSMEINDDQLFYGSDSEFEDIETDPDNSTDEDETDSDTSTDEDETDSDTSTDEDETDDSDTSTDEDESCPYNWTGEGSSPYPYSWTDEDESDLDISTDEGESDGDISTDEGNYSTTDDDTEESSDDSSDEAVSADSGEAFSEDDEDPDGDELIRFLFSN